MLDSQTILETVRRNVNLVVPEIEQSEVVSEASLTDLGCNSVDRADVVTTTMEELGISVPIAEFREVGDVASLVELLRVNS
ncbi:polyketide biosynthesis acyl carrier protein [Actinopolyspora lacussalsi]|nr:polyketide biosynthesis acyl carrier protein [Actinopolyspora lacussalsi]